MIECNVIDQALEAGDMRILFLGSPRIYPPQRNGADATGFERRISLGHSKSDGVPRKLLNDSRLSTMGWRPRVAMPDCDKSTYRRFRDNAHGSRKS
jgi:hypothetical protein